MATVKCILTLVMLSCAFALPTYADPVCDETNADCRESIDIPDIYIISVDPATIIAVLLHCREELEGDYALHYDGQSMSYKGKDTPILIQEVNELIKRLQDDTE